MHLLTIYLTISRVESINRKVEIALYKCSFLYKKLASFQRYNTIDPQVFSYLT